MNIKYYDDHAAEFEAITLALKKQMETIWGESLKENGDTLDDEAVYAVLFEELQYNFSPQSFSELDPAQTLNEDQIAAFVARSRRYKTGITVKCVPGKPHKWLKACIAPYEKAEGTNLIWIDAAAIEHIGAVSQFEDQYYLSVTTRSGQTYRVNDFRLPGRLLESAHDTLFRALNSTTGGNF